jgi:hypothetical protein
MLEAPGPRQWLLYSGEGVEYGNVGCCLALAAVPRTVRSKRRALHEVRSSLLSSEADLS